MICKHIFVKTSLNKPEIIFIFCTQINGFNYCYLTLIILFDINHLFAESEVVTIIAI